MKRQVVLVSGAALALLGLAAAAASQITDHCEEPAYLVVASDGPIEVRQYPASVVARVTVQGAGREAANRAFRILAGFIFGQNKTRQKLAMTVPVTEKIGSQKIAMTAPVTTLEGDGSMQMSFFMPSNYTLETLPIPTDKTIQIESTSPIRYAVIRFAGSAQERAVQDETAKLLSYMRAHGLKVGGSSVCAFYNPPWTLPFLRRNEVWIPIKMP